jgi:hypothetical protein
MNGAYQNYRSQETTLHIMLAITAERQKLLAYVIFKQKTVAVPSGNYSMGLGKWPVDWKAGLNLYGFSDCSALLCQQSVLILDSLWGHTTENLKTQVQ